MAEAVAIEEFDYLHPDYTEVFKERAERLMRMRRDPALLAAAKIHYKENPWDFINDWGMTFDPRKLDDGETPHMPFLLWPRQREYLVWLQGMWKNKHRGQVEKSRDGGVSWLSVAWACTNWLFVPGFVAGFGSRKEELVDKTGDNKALFYMVRYFIDNIPVEFKPEGFSERLHSAYMRMNNPETGSALVGEAGSEIGRGGRSQPLRAKLLTPDGWCCMGDVVVGQNVVGSNGRPTKIIKVWPRQIEDVYRLTFNDGSYTECGGDHLWQVTTSPIRKSLSRAAKASSLQRSQRHAGSVDFLIKTTKELMQTQMVRGDGQVEYLYQIPIVQAVEGSDKSLPLDPYLVGALLGDGCFTQMDTSSPTFTNHDEYFIGELEKLLPAGCEFQATGGLYSYRVVDRACLRGRGYKSAMKQAIDDAGLNRVLSYQKKIPEGYLRSSTANRLSLLQGLMDTDGWLARPTKPCFSSTSKELAEGVRELVMSLGGVATITRRKGGPRTFPGQRVSQCRESYQVTICMPGHLVPFRLPRYVDAFQPRTTYKPRRSLVSVELVGNEETQCISVDASDQLYVTDDYIVTHNCSVYFVDEAAYVADQVSIDTSLSATTECQINISTFQGSGNRFFMMNQKLKAETPEKVFIFDWRDDPRKNEEWARRKQAELNDEVIWAQEYERDPYASQTDSFIPAKHVLAAIDAHLKLGFDGSGIRAAGFDPADTGDAKGFAFRHGSVLWECEELHDGDITYAIPWAYDKADALRAEVMGFEADGMGAPAMKLAFQDRSGERMRVEAWHGSAGVDDPDGVYLKANTPQGVDKTNHDAYANHKAQDWDKLATRFKNTYQAMQRQEQGFMINADPDDLISLSSECTHLDALKAELSSPKREWTDNGKIRVEGKKKMKARQIKSPNLAEALVVCFSMRKPVPGRKRSPMRTSGRRALKDRGMGY